MSDSSKVDMVDNVSRMVDVSSAVLGKNRRELSRALAPAVEKFLAQAPAAGAGKPQAPVEEQVGALVNKDG